MTTITKALVGTIAAGAMAMVPAASASASDRYGRDRGISAGEIIAGAVVLGGIAAVAASIGGNNRYDDRYYRGGNYGYYNGDPRNAVEQCVNAARQDAGSRGYGNVAVRQIRSVNDTSYGWKIKGDIAVAGNRGYYNGGGYDDRGYNRNYDNGYYNNGRYDDRYNRGGYGDRYGYGQDTGSFTCWIDRGRVSRMDYSGIRGL